MIGCMSVSVYMFTDITVMIYGSDCRCFLSIKEVCMMT